MAVPKPSLNILSPGVIHTSLPSLSSLSYGLVIVPSNSFFVQETLTRIVVGLGVLFAIHAVADVKCHRHTSDCMSLWVSTVLAFLTFLSSCICVAIVMCPVAVAGGGYNTHVEDARKRARNFALDRQQSETGDPHIELPNAHDTALVLRPPPTHIF
ncbi:hypothetical protein JOM56_004357 [Amanita muscaria]